METSRGRSAPDFKPAKAGFVKAGAVSTAGMVEQLARPLATRQALGWAIGMSLNPEPPPVSEEALERERAEARALAASSWWRNRLIRGRCHLCGGEFSAAQLVMDFKVALARGGKAERGNAVPACGTCQENRGRLSALEWEEYLKGQGWDPADDDGNGE